MKGHRPWRLSSATLVKLLSEVYVEAALSISARINLVYVPFFIIGELSVRMQINRLPNGVLEREPRVRDVDV